MPGLISYQVEAQLIFLRKWEPWVHFNVRIELVFWCLTIGGRAHLLTVLFQARNLDRVIFLDRISMSVVSGEKSNSTRIAWLGNARVEAVRV